MKNLYIIAGKRRFHTLEEAIAFANRVYVRTGILVSVECLETCEKVGGSHGN